LLDHPVAQRIVRTLERRGRLQDDDLVAFGSLNSRRKVVQPGGYIVREGAASDECTLLLDGFAYRQKLNQQGGRQILSFHVAGDFVGLESALLNVADHSVQALTRCEIAAIPAREMAALIEARPRIARALWVETLIDSSIFREWIMNVGRRPAKQRLAHLLCELAMRLKLAGLGDENGFSLPMTQEQLADATGLTPVHVNRSLKALENEGLIVRQRRYLGIPDWQRLRAASGFNDLYLHFDQAA
jgi:CRP-like cAMP-binding protein